jgi:CDP-glucose 4,6-dehydratase
MELINPSFWKNKKVFLTGHTGFKGSWLTTLFDEMGTSVMGYALEPKSRNDLWNHLRFSSRIDSVIADIRDQKKLTDSMIAFAPEIVIHMAAQAIVA